MAACQAVGDVAVTCGTPARQVPRDGRKSRTTQPKRDRSGIALGGARDANVAARRWADLLIIFE
jgi:hypothetical protein